MKILIYSHRIGSKTITFIHNEINQLAEDQDIYLFHNIAENHLSLSDAIKLEHISHYSPRIFLHLADTFKKITGKYPPMDKFRKKWQSTIENYNPDIIHLHFGTNAERVLYKNIVRDRPVFISFHGYDASRKLNDQNYLQRLSYLFSLKNIHPIFVSHYMYNNVKKALAVNRIDNARILYYGTDLSFFERTQDNRDQKLKTFLQVSSFVPKKGHQYTLKAIREFIRNYKGDKEVRFILAGGGPLLDEIKEMSNRMGLDDIISFPGWVTKEEAREWMMKADYFIHHSIIDENGDMEGIPNAIMEAMAMKLPILSTLHSGIPELVTEGVNGYLVKEKDIQSYAQRIEDILEMPLLEENRIKVLKDFEMKKHKERLISFYKEALQN